MSTGRGNPTQTGREGRSGGFSFAFCGKQPFLGTQQSREQRRVRGVVLGQLRRLLEDEDPHGNLLVGPVPKGGKRRGGRESASASASAPRLRRGAWGRTSLRAGLLPARKESKRERDSPRDRRARLVSSFSLACRKKSRPGFGAHGRSKPPDAADAAGLAVRAASSGRPSIPSGLRHIMKPGPEPARMPARMPESHRSSTDTGRASLCLFGAPLAQARERRKPQSRSAARSQGLELDLNALPEVPKPKVRRCAKCAPGPFKQRNSMLSAYLCGVQA